MRVSTILIGACGATAALASPVFQADSGSCKSAQGIIDDIHHFKDKTKLFTENIYKMDVDRLWGIQGDVKSTINNINNDLKKSGNKFSKEDFNGLATAMHEAMPNMLDTLKALSEKAEACFKDYKLGYSQIEDGIKDIEHSTEGAMDEIIKGCASEDSDLIKNDKSIVDAEFHRAEKAYTCSIMKAWWAKWCNPLQNY